MDRLELGPVVAMRSPNIKYVRIDASGFMTAAQLASALGDPRLGQFVSQTGWSAAVLNASGMDRFGTDDVEWMSEQWAPMLASVNVRKLSVVVAERVHMLFKSVFAGLAPRAMKAGVELRYFPSAQFTSTFESVTWFETPAAPRSGPGPLFEAPLIIDRPAWVAANCGGIAFLTPANGPPGLGFIFQDAAAAIHIFEGWRRRFGERDEAEMLRVAIIEGDILGKQSGYTLTIGPNLEAIVARAVPSGGLSVDITKLGGWLRRMDTPPTGSPHLQTFKQMYAASTRSRRSYSPMVDSSRCINIRSSNDSCTCVTRVKSSNEGIPTWESSRDSSARSIERRGLMSFGDFDFESFWDAPTFEGFVRRLESEFDFRV